MTIPRPFLAVPLTALVVLCSSVFYFGEVAYAETMPLAQADQVIEQQSQKNAEKESQLKDTSNDIQDLLDKKLALAQQLNQAKTDIDTLNKRIADKKAAAEAEAARVKALQNMFVRVTSYASGSAGNWYGVGYCTWYVKNRRPDLPNNLGNANTWYTMASADGYNVGSAPKKGAVGTTTRGALGHVVYVEGVSLDGSTVTISEMNWAGLYSLRTRTANASEFLYIYELK